MKNTSGGVLLLVKLHVEACNFSKIILHHGCSARFLNCTNDTKSSKASHMHFLFTGSGSCESFSGIHTLQKSTSLKKNNSLENENKYIENCRFNI